MDRTDTLTSLLAEFLGRISSWEHHAVRDETLTLPQMHCIEILGTHGPMRMKELAERMGVTTGTLTVLADRMQRRTLVTRMQHETDRRGVVLAATDKGRAVFEHCRELHSQLVADMTADFTDEEMTTLCGLMARMTNRLRPQDGAAGHT
ncbi:DNA-binding MarR family transcriptional regulator [Desulfobaculum xiamenense]|uniref:DNA-binding MarR family transcriptional regulator n=1 Tax=Desulfobaculum xiamenense TaxID=995050 RepID=A0A846QS41_9BACT|nr:MarR family transcriptional regulator [Desulfobaculum xiamenense]NJB67479.1 DNA-binding MarR family transcriptional regulator [Desulfobaculum xiamenense]